MKQFPPINNNIPWIFDPLHGGRFLGPVACFRRKYVNHTAGNAILQITAMGLFEIFSDGHSITDELFAPGWFDYRKRAEYRTYPLALTKGEHTLSIYLADGWYGGKIAGQKHGIPKLLVHLVLPDGKIIDSDSDWECSSDGPILYSDIYEGECCDQTREWQNWHTPEQIKINVELEPFSSFPVRRKEHHVPIFIRGNIIDFGQNLTGREILHFTANRGDKITIRHAEVLNPDGSLYTENLRTSKSTNMIIASGGESTWESHFSFHGFRYLEVTGAKKFQAEAYSIRTDYPLHLEFDCSNPLLNQLVKNIRWGWLDNSLDIPTDCPQRDERFGWLGDAQVFIRSACYLSDCTVFFRRWLKDVRHACNSDGAYPIIAPYTLSKYNVAGWSDAGIICPWILYDFSGNQEILEENYETIRKFTIYRRKEFDAGRLPNANFGDWLNINDPSDPEVLAAEYLAFSGNLACKIARVLQQTEDAELFMKWSEDYKQFFIEHCCEKLNSQTTKVLALRFDLLPENLKKKCADELSGQIRKKFNTHLSTGFLGTPHLLHALSENGHRDLAWELLEQTTFPSWLYSVENGATTIWEHWDSWTPENGFKDPKMNSFNHYAYGAVLDWIMKDAAGISYDFNVDPHPGGTLSYMEATYRGLKVRWEKANKQYRCFISVPPGISAKFRNTPLSPGEHEFVL